MSEKDAVKEKNTGEYDAHARSWQAAMSTNVGHKYLEKPAIEKELPGTFEGKAVLCIGVGSGDELQEILARNPARVTGIDLSAELLNIARSGFPGVELQQMDMTAMDFPDASFDFVYSSLTLHYAKDWDVLCTEIYRVLKKGGELLFSTHHPDYWSRKTATGNTYTNQRGIILTEHTALLPGDVTIIYYNHPGINSILDAMEHAGFEIETSFAPTVIDVAADTLAEQEAASFRELKTINAELPLFFIVKAIKR